MIENIFVFDDIIDPKEQEEIKNKLFENDNVSWFYKKDITKYSDLNKQKRPGFSHYFIINKKSNSEFHNLPLNIIINSCKKINFNLKQIIQSRSFLQLPLNEKFLGEGLDTPHIDIEEEHIVILYYVNDSDGDTVIYENKYEKNKKVNIKDLKIKKTINPKQGRVIIFNGHLYHTGQQPQKDVRCIINSNIY
jgi:hypothetical protein